MCRFFSILLGTVSATSFFSAHMAHADGDLYGAYAEHSGNFSSGRSIGQVDLFTPLLQNEESLNTIRKEWCPEEDLTIFILTC